MINRMISRMRATAPIPMYMASPSLRDPDERGPLTEEIYRSSASLKRASSAGSSVRGRTGCPTRGIRSFDASSSWPEITPKAGKQRDGAEADDHQVDDPVP